VDLPGGSANGSAEAELTPHRHVSLFSQLLGSWQGQALFKRSCFEPARNVQSIDGAASAAFEQP
jgi:hypothetical protein